MSSHHFHALCFGVTGELLPCTDKGKLVSILEKLAKEKTIDDVEELQRMSVGDALPQPKKVTVIDGMGVVQSMGNPTWVTTCADWADHFNAILDNKSKDYNEVHLIFDRYDVLNSLKTATHDRRNTGVTSTAYHVTDSTPIGKVTTKQFLSCTSTKDELTVYLAQKALSHFEGKDQNFIVTSRKDVFSNNIDVDHLRSSQEEADTKNVSAQHRCCRKRSYRLVYSIA